MNKLMKKARFWAKLLSFCPGVLAIFLSGSLATGTANKNSDIDFFIITKNGKIWTARFFVFMVLKIFCQLAKPQSHIGKICPNHFITDLNLEIIEQDTYAAQLFSKNIPLSDLRNIFPIFAKKNQKWVLKFNESFPKNVLEENSDFKPVINKTSFLEKIFQAIQVWKIKKNPDYQEPKAKIVLNKNELRFHPKPKNLEKNK
jgi:hypothetical protein